MEKYHEIWETNKETFIAKYASFNPPLSKFDADIARYSEVANNVQKEETLVAINFVMLDCSLLKISIVDHCDVWQSKFTSLLYTMTCNQLDVRCRRRKERYRKREREGERKKRERKTERKKEMKR